MNFSSRVANAGGALSRTVSAAAARLETLAQWPVDPGRRRILVALIGVALLLECALFSPIWAPHIVSADLDASWMAAFNALAFSDVNFATGIVYTYGPLGFLLSLSYWPETYWIQVGWWMVLAAAIGWGYFAIARNAGLMFALGGAAAIAIFPLQVIERDAWMLAGYASLALAAGAGATPGLRRISAWAFVGLAIVAALTKFTFFLAAAILVILIDAISMRQDRRLPILTPVWLAGVIALWMFVGENGLEFIGFVQSRLQISSGYSDVLSIPGPAREVALYMVYCGVFATAIMVSLRDRDLFSRALLVTVCALIIYISASTGFIRHEYRLSATETLLIVTAFMAMVFAARNRIYPALAGGLLFAGAIAVHGVGMMMRTEIEASNHITRMATSAPQRAGRAVQMLAGNGRLQAQHERAMIRIVEDFPLPELEGGVDYLGFRNAVVFAHGYEWNARPVFQDYQTYNAALIERNATYYRSENAPRHVIVDMIRFAGTPGLMLDSGSYAELLARYRLVQRYERAAHFELCTTPGTINLRPIGNVRLDLEENFAPPWIRNHAVWVEAEVEITLLGRLLGSLFKRSELYARMRIADGTAPVYRFPAGAASAGFLLSPRIDEQSELLWAAESGLDALIQRRAVENIRFEPGQPFGNWVYRSVNLRFFEFELERSACDVEANVNVRDD